MSAVNNLLDKYREKCSLASDSALATSLHMSRQGVHQWRRGLSWPSEDHIIKMATAINEPAERWFVAISADKASPAGRKVWLRLAQAAAAVVIMYTFGHIDGHSVEATALAFGAHNPALCILCQITEGVTKRWPTQHPSLVPPDLPRVNADPVQPDS